MVQAADRAKITPAENQVTCLQIILSLTDTLPKFCRFGFQLFTHSPTDQKRINLLHTDKISRWPQLLMLLSYRYDNQTRWQSHMFTLYAGQCQLPMKWSSHSQHSMDLQVWCTLHYKFSPPLHRNLTLSTLNPWSMPTCNLMCNLFFLRQCQLQHDLMFTALNYQ